MVECGGARMSRSRQDREDGMRLLQSSGGTAGVFAPACMTPYCYSACRLRLAGVGLMDSGPQDTLWLRTPYGTNSCGINKMRCAMIGIFVYEMSSHGVGIIEVRRDSIVKGKLFPPLALSFFVFTWQSLEA